MQLTAWFVPLVIALILVTAIFKKVDILRVFTEAAREGLTTTVSLLPTLILLMTCVGMLRASGGLFEITKLLAPVAEMLGLPSEVVPLALLRPLSGSGALVIFEDLLSQVGADSMAGRVASVLMGSTETTFYTIAVYYGAIGIRKTRHTLPAALAGDITGFVFSALVVNILL